MGFHNQNYPRAIVPNPHDPAGVDFRAFYPYHPNEVKHRKRTTTQQLKTLEDVFKNDTKPNANLRIKLAHDLSMTPRGVQVWFQNRRAKEKGKVGKMLSGKGLPFSLAKNLKKEEELATPLVIKDEASPTEALFADADDSLDQLDAFSRSPSGSASPPAVPSPPQLHVITDNFSWNNSPVENPPDSAASHTSSRPPMFQSRTMPPTAFYGRLGNVGASNDEVYGLRRGSLPVNAFPPPQPSLELDSFDPLVRRRSVDASLQRLASNPFASHARAKNSALYGPGVGVVMPGSNAPPGGVGPTRHHPANRLPHGYHQRRLPSQFANPMSEHEAMRRFSMDSRTTRFTPLSRLQQSPSPSPLTPYNAVVRASLPENHLYAVTTRTVASPIPGPLPSPGFQFGAASSSIPSMPSPSSGDSERNSPDSLRSFNFRGEEQDDDSLTSPSYDAYSSRFGSIASIATSESSVNSAYYAELGGSAVDHNERRDSCASGHFLGMLSGLDVSNQVEHMPHSVSMSGIGFGIGAAVGGYPPHEDFTFAAAVEGGVEMVDSQMQRQHEAQQHYASPSSTISPSDGSGSNGQSPHEQDTPSVPISSSSELAFALESKQSEQVLQEGYVNYTNGEHLPQGHGEELQQQDSYYHQQEQLQNCQPDGYVPTYAFSNDGQLQQSHLDYNVYSSNGEYSEALAGANVLDNGLQSVEAFVAYT